MSEYQLELKQIMDYPRCQIYRQFIGMLMNDKNIRINGSSGLYCFTVLSCYANFRTSYKCKNCGYEIVPTYMQALNAMHRGTTRYLKCPKCNKRTWCKKVLKK